MTLGDSLDAGNHDVALVAVALLFIGAMAIAEWRMRRRAR